MKKNKKVLGIKNPNALDFVLASIFAIITIGAIWLGVWVSMKNAYGISNLAWNNFVDCFTLQFEKIFTWQGFICSFLAYLGGVIAVVLIFASMIKRSARGIMGAICVLLCGSAGSLFFSFFYYFANPVKTKVTGIFPIGILCVCVFLLYFAKLGIDLSIQYMNEKNDKEEPTKVEYIYVNENEYPVNEGYYEDDYEYPQVYDNDDQYTEDQTTQDEFSSLDIKRLTFEEKLDRAEVEVRNKYYELKEYFEQIGFSCKVVKTGAIFYHKNAKQAVITVSGKNALKVYYKLDYENYKDTTMPVIDVQNKKKYEKTPVCLKVKSELSVKRAKQLMDDVKAQYGDSFVPYISSRNIKQEPEKKIEPKIKPKKEKQYKEPVIEHNEFLNLDIKRLTFEEKLDRAGEEVESNYLELKEYFEDLGFNLKVTKNAAIFYYKNVKQAVITVSGKSSLKVYYKLDYENYKDTTIPVVYIQDKKKFEKTPVCLKVKSELSVKRAKQLMDDVRATLLND